MTSQVLNYEKLTQIASREAKKGAEKMLKLRELPPIKLDEINKVIKSLIETNSEKKSIEEKTLIVPTVKNNVPVDTDKLKAEEKILKLSESITQASSSLIQSIQLGDLFKVLYEFPEIRHKVNTGKPQLVPKLLELKNCAKNRHDKRVLGSVNEILALLGHVDQNVIKRRGINILSLDGGGNPRV